MQKLGTANETLLIQNFYDHFLVSLSQKHYLCIKISKTYMHLYAITY